MKYIKTYENTKYLSDEEIESSYDDFIITEFGVDRIFDDGGATGHIEIRCNDDLNIYDNWIKYDSGPRIAFDNWYPDKIVNKLKKYIEKGIKKEILKRNIKKYNL
jgi:hypothetical protein